MATAVGKIKFRHQTAIANNPAYDVSANVFNDSFVTGVDVATDLGVDGDVMVRDSAQADGWGWQTVAGLVTPVTPAEGGTGIVSYTAGDMLYASGTTTLAKLAIVAAGQVLVSGTSPAWSANPSLTSVVTPLIGTATDVLTALQVNGGIRWYVGASAAAYTWFPNADNANDIGNSTSRVRSGYFGTALVVGINPAQAAGILRTGNGTGWFSRDSTNLLDKFVIGYGTSFADTISIGQAGVNAVVMSNFLPFGGVTSSFPALQRNGSGLNVRLADDSGYASLTAGSIFAAAAFSGPGTYATSGDWRAQSGFSFAYRNSANSANVLILSSDSSDRALFGDPGNGVMGVLYGTRIGLGGTTSSFPSLKRSGTGVAVRLADDSGDAGLTASSLIASTVTASSALFGPGTTASTGDIRLQNMAIITARNAANNGDLSMIATDSSNRVLIADSANVTTVLQSGLASARLAFGGVTSASPMLKRSSAILQSRLADDSAYAQFDAFGYSAGGVAGISASITTASLVGKTITVVNGIITAFV